MTRSVVVIIAGLLCVGSIVALLPAQESSRRTASKFRPGYQPQSAASGEPAGLAPLPGLAPVVTPSGRFMPGGMRSMPGSTAEEAGPVSSPGGFKSDPRQFSADSGAFSPSDNGEAATAAPDTAGESDADASQLHSVLKRNRPAVIYESPAPQSAAPPPFAPSSSAPSSSALPPSALSPSALSPSVSATPAERTILSQPEPAPAPVTSAPPRKTGSAFPAPRRTLEAASAPPPRVPSTTTNAAPRAGHDITASSKAHALRVDVAGPQALTVGKPATYVITLANDGDSVADDVQVRITLPSWVSVNSSQPSSGEADMQTDSHGVARLVWSVPRAGVRAKEQVQLQLVTGQGDGFELGVEYTCRPAFTKAAISVKQPQLELSLNGPAEMTFGEEKTFTLSVSNPGSGDAEHVVVTVAAGDSPPVPFDAGSIPAGHKKELPLQVVASQAGILSLAVSATAESGLEAQTAGKINVRKAEVNVAVAGPPLKYAGTEGQYVVTVANTGTAAADNVNLTIALPPGAKYLGGIDGASPTSSGLKWQIASLPPGSERAYEVRLQLNTAGTNQVVVQSQATASGTATCQTETTVEAVADLKLVVNDPDGPVPTAENAVYELQVLNRGSQAARQVKIVVQFGEGIEPVSFEGCEARIVPGQVVCHPLAQLGAGEQVTLRVKAQAKQAGTHQFRVEVTSTDGDARLVSEGTTRFFSETGRGGAAATTAKKPSLLPAPATPGLLR